MFISEIVGVYIRSGTNVLATKEPFSLENIEVEQSEVSQLIDNWNKFDY